MSNVWFVIIVFFLFGLISQVSMSLGLTSLAIEYPAIPITAGDLTFLEGLSFVITYALNNLSSFFQIITFRTGLPIIFNVILISPIGAGMVFLGIITIRGTS